MKKRSINKNVNKIIDKRTLRKIKKNVKGITLIALVVTIVLNCVCHEKVERLL